MTQKTIISLLCLAVFLSPLHAGSILSKIVVKDDQQAKKELKERQEVIALAERIFPVKELLPIIYAYARSFQLIFANKHRVSDESIEALVACSDGSLLCQSIVATFDLDSATYGKKSTLRRLDPVTSTTKKSRQWPVLNTQYTPLAVLPDNRSFCADDATLLEIPSQPSRSIVYHPNHSDAITTLLVLPNGNLLSASLDKRIKEWTLVQQPNADGGFLNLVRIYRGHTQAVHSLAQQPNRKFVSGSDDGTLREWVPGTMRPVRTVMHASANKQLAFRFLDVFPNGKLLSAALKSEMAIWNTQKEKIEQEQTFSSQSTITSLAVLNDAHFISSSTNGTMLLWRVGSTEPVQKLENGIKSITRLARAGNKLFVGSQDGCVGEWVDDDRSALERAFESIKLQATPFTTSTTAAPKP